MTRVFLDLETTGLDPDRHAVWEAAYAVDDGPVLSGVLVHDLTGYDPTALRLNGYRDRIGAHAYRPLADRLDFEDGLRAALEGATVVGANPAFDTAFLRARWGVAPWRYRLLDVEAYAMPALGLDEPIGLAAIADRLRALGYSIPVPDHSAAADVATLREVHRALRLDYIERGLL